MHHGTHDELFSITGVAIPLRDQLKAAGYEVTWIAAQGAGHMPESGWSREFVKAWLALGAARAAGDSEPPAQGHAAAAAAAEREPSAAEPPAAAQQQAEEDEDDLVMV